ncbi:MAG TPA: Holliday junction branch migration DNA helicase RuvB [Planctomycetota bacterium]|nr:Holliday junction branch migration DNA helicase RuvB [Planctomycetota bacterium]
MEFRPALDRDETERRGDSPDAHLDRALRPQELRGFIGQGRVVENLQIAIEAAKQRSEPVDHILLSGLPGLGKTTLAEIVAKEMGTNLRATSGPVIDKPSDLAGLLTSLSPGDVLFVDEIHRVPIQVEEYLYSAMEDFRLVIVLDQGPRARSVPIQLAPFTLVGATTREGLLSSPFRARFGIHERLDPYPKSDLVAIAERSAAMLGMPLRGRAAEVLAERSRGTPRLINRYLRRLRDFAQVLGRLEIDEQVAMNALTRLGVDQAGLLELDRRLLNLLKNSGRPVGLKTLSVALGEEDRTIEDVVEPFLIREGFIEKTPRGRSISAMGLAYLEARRNARPHGTEDAP